jgi:prepilin-type N-terminal cleavage/methylation domain-containing protein
MHVTALPRRLHSRLDSEAGFTLVELLVAMTAGLVVMMGLVSIIVVTVHQTQRTFTSVDATRRARTALAGLENELHSGCVNGTPPIQTGSDPNNLSFISYYGTSASPQPIWHRLTFSAGTLTDSTYNVTGSSPDFTQGTLIPGGTTTVLTNVAPQSGTPVFQYYTYTLVAGYTDSKLNIFYMIADGSTIQPGTTSLTPSSPLSATGGLSDASANTVVEVVVNLLVGASSANLNGPTSHAGDDPVTDTISLRLTTPPDFVPAGTFVAPGAVPVGYGPCA